jgi:hypothetical protein
VNETDLQAAFTEIRGLDAPPHGLTPDALLTAGKRAQRRRRQMIAAGAILTAAVAAILPVLLGLAMSTGTHPAPATSGNPTGVVTSRPGVPLPTVPTPTGTPEVTPSHTGTPPGQVTPGAGAPSQTAGAPHGTGIGTPSPGAGSGSGSPVPSTPSPNAGTAAPSSSPR